MALVPTNRYMNMSATWTSPTGGTATPLRGIKSAAYNEGIESLLEAADFDLFHTVGGVTMISPTMTIRTIDAFALLSTVAGTFGTLAVTFGDFNNAAAIGGGAKIVSMSNAFIGARNHDGEYRQLATQNLTFNCTSVDGSTSPVAVASA